MRDGTAGDVLVRDWPGIASNGRIWERNERIIKFFDVNVCKKFVVLAKNEDINTGKYFALKAR